MLTASEIRNRFLDFFKGKGHSIVPSAPIVIKDDPTLMFTNAGMNQFKDIFLGTQTATHQRVADTQKCLRVSGKHNDLEEVGVDTYHHTMFEMLGNWSFGDYFKKDAIAWGWEFLTSELGIDKERIYVTVFEGDKTDGLAFDKEAYEEWAKHIDPSRILNGNKKDNFWEMGDTGPCGPCSEIHIDARPDSERKDVDGAELVNKDHPMVIEVWNMVFIQYNRMADQSLKLLPQQHVDTGMGFERLVRTIQGKTSNYDTDVFRPLIQAIEQLCGKSYGEKTESDIAFRVIADHIRAVAFCIADGQLPSNTGAGYVIRRILRRAVRYGYSFLDIRQPFFHQLVPVLAGQMKEVFPELIAQEELVSKVIHEEESTFLHTLENGLKRMHTVTEDLQKKNQTTIPGEVVFELYDTFGFPHDLTALLAHEQGFRIDEKGFNEALARQKERSRKAGTVEAGDWEVLIPDSPVTFTGYDETRGEARIIRMRKVKQKNKDLFQVVLDRTPFYAESGGQVGDTGILKVNGQQLQVIDTRKENDLIVHYTNALPQHPDRSVMAEIDETRRHSISRNHSATHLLHAALKEVLGDHVQQKGSYVGPDRLRFDFSHFSKMTEEEITRVSDIVNQRIRENISLDEQRNVPIEEAKNMGATMLFGEKYGEKVRVITFDPSFSRELCGGIHVNATGSIGYFRILSEAAVAAGVRRIEAITGTASEAFIDDHIRQLNAVKELLKNQDVVTGVENLVKQQAELRQELEAYQLRQLNSEKARLRSLISDWKGNNLITSVVEVSNADHLKKLAYDLRNEITNMVAVLGADIQGKPMLAVMIDDAVLEKQKLHAGRLVKQLGTYIQGGGGGQPHFATAGGKNPEGLAEAINNVEELLNAEAVN